MDAPKLLSKPTIEIFKMPRKEMDFFKAGKLYKLRFNDPYKYRIRYSIVDVKQLDNAEIPNLKKTITNIVSLQLIKNFNIDYIIETNAELYNSFMLNDTFICLEANGIILRNFKSTINGKDIDACVFKQVPIFLFHDKKNQKPIIGAIQIDLNKQDINELFVETKEVMTNDNLVYVENLFEEVQSQ